MKIISQYRIIGLSILIVVLSILHVIVLNADSTEGDILTDISEQMNLLTRDNMELSAQVASASSIATISEKALSMGLVKSVRMISLASSLQLSYTDESTL